MAYTSRTEQRMSRVIEDRVRNGEDYVTARREVRREYLENNYFDTKDCFPDGDQIPDEGAWIQVIAAPKSGFMTKRTVQADSPNANTSLHKRCSECASGEN